MKDALRKHLGLGFITAQLALVLVALSLFRIGENFGLTKLLPLLLVGFVAHAVAPRVVRPPLFAALSMTAIVVVFGIQSGATLIAIGTILVGICHIPIRVRFRIVALLMAAAALAMLRAHWIETPAIPSLILPVLGSMFMFRLILYLYHVAHANKPASIAKRLGYFFMAPNICLPLFPIVDYDTYLRTYYDTDPNRIYQKGVYWMTRGITHILIYRAIYHFLWIEPADVTSLGSLVYFMVTSYTLYLRISGQLHLAVGILCLFGFNLPKTHYLYFMATGFNDLWRRMNIYWRDFMMKCFYYPLYFRLRKSGTIRAMVFSVFFVFAGTWLLHPYQWFWLRGSFPMTTVDTVFWSAFALCMVANSLLEIRRPRTKRLKGSKQSVQDVLLLSAKSMGMFCTMCVLWSFISSTTIAEWMELMAAGTNVQPTEPVCIAAFLIGLFLLFALLHKLVDVYRDRPKTTRQATIATLTATAAFLVLGLPMMQNLMGPDFADFADVLQSDRLNQRDQDLVDRGYYERVMAMDRYTAQLWDAQLQAPAGWNDPSPIINRDASRPFSWELFPLLDTTFKRGRLTTNRWGMRDKDYEKEKPPNTYRIAVLGGSATFGSGVDDGLTFEAQLEDRLNQADATHRYTHYELLNFSVPGHDLLRRLVTLEQKALSFSPDMAWHVSIGPEEKRSIINRLIGAVRRGATWPYEELETIRIESGVKRGMTDAEIQRRLQPYGQTLVEWGYRHMVETCRVHHIVPVWVFMANPRRPVDEKELAAIEAVAREAGFEILSSRGAFDGHAMESMRITPWDAHPNAKAHRLLADKLYEQLLSNGASSLPLGLETHTISH